MTKHKKRKDGECEFMRSDDAQFLVMRGNYTAEQIIAAAVEQGEIGQEDSVDWQMANYYQTHYKISPIGGADGYGNWHHPRDTPCRGSYFASVLQWD
ncbi:hypothetical protein SAMN02744783_04763 [Serratia sp. CC22-02]|uniref:hypothetical protein n=1 Tax=Serratia sp. CC22-02 TaxID=1378076 RepID=UPI0024033F8E|nr:hypothetical protein [Serratia sp. CC22-02]SMP80950.1 hypothetical protein SAMN02744783_04763 [Serratia sp. CC22-02]